MNIYQIVTHDFHDICFQQESGGTESAVGLPEAETMKETLNPQQRTLHFEEVDTDSVPGGSGQDNHAVPSICEVSCLH
jgi:hypothetical protein